MSAAALPVAAARSDALEVSTTLHEKLRATTRDAHEAIDRAMDWEGRVSSLAGYRELLCRWHGFHAVWEPAAATLLDDEPFFAPRRKLHLLAADLRHLGMTNAIIAALPECQPFAAMSTRADALGAMYVIEGSTLGGQVIARRIVETLGLARGGGCSFYQAYGPAVGPMWREFRNRLLAVESDQHAAVLHAANATFACLHRWLCPDSPPREILSA